MDEATGRTLELSPEGDSAYSRYNFHDELVEALEGMVDQCDCNDNPRWVNRKVVCDKCADESALLDKIKGEVEGK